MSIDGKIALPSKRPLKLSSFEDFKRVHELRNYCDGVLVGVNTILMDDPKLTVKSDFVMEPKNPVRIVLDTHGRTPPGAKVLDGTVPSIIVMGAKYRAHQPTRAPSGFENAEILYLPTEPGYDDQIALGELMKLLKDKGTENLLVEGGETVIYNFLRKNLVDELFVYISSIVIGGSGTPTLAGGLGATSENDIIKLRLISCSQSGDGVLLNYKA